MQARVKASCRLPSIRSADMIFSKFAWEPVPERAEAEILDNELLEVREEEPPSGEGKETAEAPKKGKKGKTP